MSEAHENAPRQAEDARRSATAIVRTLVDAGYTAYFAGGCVRDHLMGHDPLDYDVATSATPKQILELFPRAQAVGESFGVMLVHHRGHSVEVATFRTEGVYSDGRHPDTVSFSDAQHDAQRRDFTINGMFEDPLNEKVIDFVGGREDLEAKVIRAIGDPHARLREDRLRMLRAVRFAARFEFAIDADTADAIRTGSEQLQGVSRERIGQEVRRMLTDVNRAVAAWEMQYLGLDRVVLEEPNKTVAPTRVGRLPDNAAYSTVLAGWLLDRNEGEDGGLESMLATLYRWSRSLVLSNAEHSASRDALVVYVTLRDEWDLIGVARQKRLAASPHFSDGLALFQTLNRPGFIDVKRRVEQLAETGLAPTPLLSGDDLIAEGMVPGPAFRRVLDAVYDSQLEGAISEKVEAVELAKTLYRTGFDTD